MRFHERATPTPGPGEWIPEDDTFTVWRLVCRVCGEGSETVEAPVDREARRIVALEFLKKHEKCLDQLSQDSPSP